MSATGAKAGRTAGSSIRGGTGIVAPPHAARRERREPAPDPNSPFAKLAALKARLEAEAKERR